MSDSTYSADRDEWFDPDRMKQEVLANMKSLIPDIDKQGDFDFIDFGSEHQMISAKQAIHKCVIETTWNEGDPVPGFEIPKGCEYAKGRIRDARVHPLTGDLQVVFDIILLFGDDENAIFKGWR